MSSAIEIPVYQEETPTLMVQHQWFAVHTFARHEKKVAGLLQEDGVEAYLPLVSRVHQWSDRRKQVELPLFPCYTFVRFAPSPESRVKVLRTDGVIGLVGNARQGEPIPEVQIESVRKLLTSNVPFDSYPFLKVGQRVRIRGGSLSGLEGILTGRQGNQRLIITVESVQRSLSICLQGFEVEAIY